MGCGEKSDRVADAQSPQRLGDKDKVIIVNPDDVVGLQQGSETGCEQFVHAPVGRPGLAVEFGQVDAVMEERPERAIGEGEIKALIVRALKIDQHAGDPAVMLDDCVPGRVVLDLAAPPEPQRVARSERRLNGGDETARISCRCTADAIGHDDQASHDFISPVAVGAAAPCCGRHMRMAAMR